MADILRLITQLPVRPAGIAQIISSQEGEPHQNAHDQDQRTGQYLVCLLYTSGREEVFLEAKQMLEDGNYHWTSTQIIHVDNPYSEDKLAILISRRCV